MFKLFAACLVAGLVTISSAIAHDFTVGTIDIDHPWARATPGQAPNGAAYMVLVNAGETQDFLVKAESPVAKRVELHTHAMEDGVMEMRPVEKIQVAPGEPTVLQPGGLHVMLIGLEAPLKEGESFPLTLTFQEAGKTEVTVAVESVGAMQPSGGKN